jgi:hypothetical protein
MSSYAIITYHISRHYLETKLIEPETFGYRLATTIGREERFYNY